MTHAITIHTELAGDILGFSSITAIHENCGQALALHRHPILDDYQFLCDCGFKLTLGQTGPETHDLKLASISRETSKIKDCELSIKQKKSRKPKADGILGTKSCQSTT